MSWSPEQYLKFEDERSRPARELLARVPLTAPKSIVDLGCGPGNSTELLVERYPTAAVCGVDSDANMLTAARKRLPEKTFALADIATWAPDGDTDLLFANAVFQWVPDHLTVLDRLLGELPSGGVLAIQMPDNLDEPSHRLMEEVRGLNNFWNGALMDDSIRRTMLPPPAGYIDRLDAKSAAIDFWHTVYYHRLKDAEAIVEWVKGTGLRPYLQPLPPADQEHFLKLYTDRIREAYPPLRDGSVLLRFPRLFMVAVRR
jgi:trans-aconitate 2-methyltransferase